jgi:hypothetical protein
LKSAEWVRSGGDSKGSKILDEFVALTGHHRKHAIRLLREKASPTQRHDQYMLPGLFHTDRLHTSTQSGASAGRQNYHVVAEAVARRA